MNRRASAWAPRTLLLLTDDAAISTQIEQCLAGFGLNHNIKWLGSVQELRTLLSSDDGSLHAQIDLCLIAYMDDAELTRQALRELQQQRRWKLIPAVTFIPPDKPELANLLYRLGANSVVSYPLRFEAIKELLCVMDHYWFDVVSLPPKPKATDPD